MLVGDGVGFFLRFLFTRFGFHWFGILSFIHFIGISHNLVMHIPVSSPVSLPF